MSWTFNTLPDARVIVCVGSGGVGKTTSSAVIALHAALQGKRALVMTIDPARRLANSLGVDALDHEIVEINLDEFRDGDDAGGSLSATMLDMKKAFDEIVERHARDEETRDAIINNRFYQFFSTGLAGAQELSASERLYEVVESGDWDLVVLDTPPTANALDFLEAPLRYFDALDSTSMSFMIQAGDVLSRKGNLFAAGSALIFKTLSRFTGTELFTELSDFLTHFSSLFDGFRERARATAKLFSDDRTAFVIVTAPDPATIDEAAWFRKRLRDFDVQLGGVVVNRVHQRFDDNVWANATINELAEALGEIDGAALIGSAELTRLGRRLLSNAREFDALAERDAATVDAFAKGFDEEADIARVPLFARDVHTLEGLDRVRRAIFERDIS